MQPMDIILSEVVSSMVSGFIDFMKNNGMAVKNRMDFKTAYEKAVLSYANEYTKSSQLYSILTDEDSDLVYNPLKRILDQPSYTRLTIASILELLLTFQKKEDKQMGEITEFLKLLFYELSAAPAYCQKVGSFMNHNQVLAAIQDSSYEMMQKLGQLKECLTPLPVPEYPEKKPLPKGPAKIKWNDQKIFFQKLWEKVLFLHKNMDFPIRLKDVYVVPDYKKDHMSFYNLDILLSKFFKSPGSGQLVIKGQPGMGKSSLICYISEYYSTSDFIFLRFYHLDKDLICEKGIWNAVKEKLGCSSRDLESRVLLLDGYDELVLPNKDEKLKDLFYEGESVENLKILVTTRENYINPLNFSSFPMITLDYFDKYKIHEFVTKFSNRTNCDIHAIAANQMTGIPLLLYILVSLGLNVSHRESFCQLYDKIFSLEETNHHSIFNRLYMDKELHPAKRAKESLHLVSQQLAYEMFDRNQLELPVESCDAIADSVLENREIEYTIGSYYSISGGQLSFVHKSMYEYFAALYISHQINSLTGRLEDDCRLLSHCFQNNRICTEIYDYLSGKIDKAKKVQYRNAFLHMLEKGMCCFCDLGKLKNTILKSEAIIFENITLCIHPFYSEKQRIKIGAANFLSQQIYNNNRAAPLNLSGFALDSVKLGGADLSGAKLAHASLKAADLSNSNLASANLTEANLMFSDLTSSNLTDANLWGANLAGAKLDIYNFSTIYPQKHNIKSMESSLIYITERQMYMPYSEFIETSYFKGLHLE